MRGLEGAVEPGVLTAHSTAHSEALIVRGTGYDNGQLDQPRAGPSCPLRAGVHPNARNRSYGRVYLRARAAEMGAFKNGRLTARGQRHRTMNGRLLTASSTRRSASTVSTSSAASILALLSVFIAAAAGACYSRGHYVSRVRIGSSHPSSSPRSRRRARSHCRVAPPLIRVIPDSLTYSAPLCLRRRCGRTLAHRSAARGRPRAARGRPGRTRPPRGSAPAHRVISDCHPSEGRAENK